MEQLLFIKISRWDCLQWKQIHLKLLERSGDNALSYLEVCHWSRQFLPDWEYAQDARSTG
jgi:hypothetical protein